MPRTWLRVVVAAALFVVAGFFAFRSWYPLGDGYFSAYKDDPDGLYWTVAGTGLAVAMIFAVSALLVVSRRFRLYGGFLLLGASSVVASVMPYVLFKWTTEDETWPWAFFVHNSIGWLHFRGRPESDGLVIQAALGSLAAAAFVTQAIVWSRRRRRGALREPILGD
jgi:hypothetical protein